MAKTKRKRYFIQVNQRKGGQRTSMDLVGALNFWDVWARDAEHARSIARKRCQEFGLHVKVVLTDLDTNN